MTAASIAQAGVQSCGHDQFKDIDSKCTTQIKTVNPSYICYLKAYFCKLLATFRYRL